MKKTFKHWQKGMGELEVTPNHSKRTYTIRRKENGITFSKYRTMSMSKVEFFAMEFYTLNDWENFLRFEEVKYIM